MRYFLRKSAYPYFININMMSHFRHLKLGARGKKKKIKQEPVLDK